jgi:hypothetical protein
MGIGKYRSAEYVVIPAKAGIHFDFVVQKADQSGFPLLRE